MATNGYMVEYARSGRSTCTACKETIDKGEMRLGSPVMFQEDSVSYKWRHWGCLTPAVLDNMRGKIERHSQEEAVLGLGQLKPKDRRRVERTLEEGLEAAEPEEGEGPSSSSEEEEEEEAPPPVKTPKKAAPKRKAPAPAKRRAQKKKDAEADEQGEEGHKPARKRAAKKA